MSTLASEVLSALQTFNDDYAKSDAATGGIERPPAGEWANICTDIEVETQGVDIQIDQAGQKIPGFRVTFRYKLVDTIPDVKEKLAWPGKPFVLPLGGLKVFPGGTEKGKGAQARISTERLKGHLLGILGPDAITNNLAADLQAALQKVKGTGGVALRVKCQYDADKQDKNKFYFQEFVTKNLAA